MLNAVVAIKGKRLGHITKMKIAINVCVLTVCFIRISNWPVSMKCHLANINGDGWKSTSTKLSIDDENGHEQEKKVVVLIINDET